MHHLPVEGQLVALEEVGAIVGAQGGLRLTVTAGCFLHLAVGIQQALLAWPSLGPAAPEGSKEAMASFAEVGRKEGVQLLPAGEGKWGRSGLSRGVSTVLTGWARLGRWQGYEPLRHDYTKALCCAEA